MTEQYIRHATEAECDVDKPVEGTEAVASTDVDLEEQLESAGEVCREDLYMVEDDDVEVGDPVEDEEEWDEEDDDDGDDYERESPLCDDEEDDLGDDDGTDGSDPDDWPTEWDGEEDEQDAEDDEDELEEPDWDDSGRALDVNPYGEPD